jgi:prepilin-type N-terminal cleavage/methylation domain-containing protein
MSRLRREDGFTLMEMLVTVILAGILLTAMMGSIASTLHWGTEVQERSVLQTELRAAVDRLAADLRQAYTGTPTGLVETAGATALTFNSPDRGTPLRLRKISYRIVNGALQRSQATSTNTGSPPWTFPSAGPWEPQVGSIVNSTVFTYADGTGAATTSAAAVKTVTITVTIATRDQRAREFTYRTSVTVRGAS